jgi:hypothetical protein
MTVPQGVDTAGPETKGTVLIKSAEELESYSKYVGVLIWSVFGAQVDAA